MLHAICHRKTNHHERYRARDADYGGPVRAEDEITSTIFGPLAMFPAEVSVAYWRTLLDRKWAEFFPGGAPEGTRYLFWERFSGVTQGRHSVEPDLLVEYLWRGDERRTLLVELKWRAPLSSDSQLQDQWLAYVSEADRPRSLHLFIAHTLTEAFAADPSGTAANTPWREHPGATSRLIPVPWTTVRSTLRDLARPEHALKNWASLAADALAALGVSDFDGFRAALGQLRAVPQGLRLARSALRWQGFDHALRALPTYLPGCRLHRPGMMRQGRSATESATGLCKETHDGQVRQRPPRHRRLSLRRHVWRAGHQLLAQAGQRSDE
jgi:hypothetical protein